MVTASLLKNGEMARPFYDFLHIALDSVINIQIASVVFDRDKSNQVKGDTTDGLKFKKITLGLFSRIRQVELILVKCTLGLQTTEKSVDNNTYKI
jgi:hypothetical protein